MNVTQTQSKFQIQSRNLNNLLESDFERIIKKTTLLWEHQADAALRIRDHLKRNKIALCVLPTGAGKSGIAVLSAYACSARRVLVITPSKHISKQMLNSFCDTNGESFLVKREIVKQEEFFNDCRPSCGGIVKNTRDINSYFDCELVISNAHKFGTNSSVSIEDISSDSIDLVIVDEAHHYPAETWRTIVDHFHDAKKVFLTATPKHNNMDILPNQERYICCRVSRQELVQKGIIRDIKFTDDTDSVDEDEAFKVNTNLIIIF